MGPLPYGTSDRVSIGATHLIGGPTDRRADRFATRVTTRTHPDIVSAIDCTGDDASILRLVGRSDSRFHVAGQWSAGRRVLSRHQCGKVIRREK